MIGLDSNVVVRYIVQDDEKQALLATEFIETECTQSSPGFISHIVLCEVIWVLKSCYSASKAQLLGLVENLLQIRQLQLEYPEVVWQALRLFRSSKADFSDVLIYVLNSNRYECQYTATFDAKAAELADMHLVGAWT